MFDLIWNYREAFLKGLKVTLELATLIWLSGLTFGSILGALGAKWPNIIGRFSWFLSFILSGIPVLVLLFWLHYPAQSLVGVVIDPFKTTVFALSLVNVFVVSEIIRNATANFPRQYIDAAIVCGISPLRSYFAIELPLITRHVIPPLLNAQVNILHMTLFGSLISVNEIFRVAQRINSNVYHPIEIYTALGMFFLMISLPPESVSQIPIKAP